MTSESSRPYVASDFDFFLPSELIAQQPVLPRSHSRLLDATDLLIKDGVFTDLLSRLSERDLLVFNDTKVLKARLHGEKSTGGKIELLVERVLPNGNVVAHMRASKKPINGSHITISKNGLVNHAGTVISRWPDEDGRLFQLSFEENAYDLMQSHGEVPLPPYIARNADDARGTDDEKNYQSIFARVPGAAAAPTASLHFDARMLDMLDTLRIPRASVTLHVGAGTFQPVKSENLSEHQMHHEWYQVPQHTQTMIQQCKARGGKVFAVGTTTVRSLESWALTGQNEGDTNIFITPGFEFKVVDAMLTNFHLPQSTLMMLISAFAGHQRVMSLYQHAVQAKYRFYSYGDAMLLSRCDTPQRSMHHA